MRHWMLAASLALALPAGSPGLAQGNEGLDVRTFRFYRAEGGETLVTGFIEIPCRLLSAAGGSAQPAGDVAVVVADSSGLELHRSAWRVSPPSGPYDPDATLLETIEFKLKPGRYSLRVTVHDSGSGREAVRTLPLSAYQGAPAASDVVLSPSIRLPDGTDTILGPGERRWGSVILTPAASMQLTPLRSRLFYLVEVYPARDAQVTMTARVMDDSGHALVTTRPRQVDVAQAGAMLRGQVDLAGLPAGHYRLAVTLDEAGSVEERWEEFTMADFGRTMEREEERLAAVKVTDAGYFGTMNEDQLNEAYAPLTYLAGPDSLAVWKTGLSLAAKRQFLTQFWQLRDPTPGTVRNEAREAFYASIAEADRRFNEGGRARVAGWRTDRGRIAIKNGEPTDVLDRRSSSGTSRPYLVWRYQRGKERYYIFADRTGFGGYKLIWSNDLKETGNPGFRDVLGPEALQDVSRWLGIDLFQGDQNRGVSAD